MVNYRSIFSMLLALLLALLLNVNAVEAAKPKKTLTYTPEQLEQIGEYVTDLQTVRDRLPELGSLINQKDWTFARNFIHGPMGELRVKMLNVARTLLPDAQPGAKKLAKDVFDDLVAIDLAAQNQNFQAAIRNYAATLKDFDTFLALVPAEARPKPEPPQPAKPALLKLPSLKPEPVNSPQFEATPELTASDLTVEPEVETPIEP